jgi:hypothetical protein
MEKPPSKRSNRKRPVTSSVVGVVARRIESAGAVRAVAVEFRPKPPAVSSAGSSGRRIERRGSWALATAPSRQDAAAAAPAVRVAAPAHPGGAPAARQLGAGLDDGHHRVEDVLRVAGVGGVLGGPSAEELVDGVQGGGLGLGLGVGLQFGGHVGRGEPAGVAGTAGMPPVVAPPVRIPAVGTGHAVHAGHAVRCVGIVSDPGPGPGPVMRESGPRARVQAPVDEFLDAGLQRQRRLTTIHDAPPFCRPGRPGVRGLSEIRRDPPCLPVRDVLVPDSV